MSLNTTIIADASYDSDYKCGGYGFWIASHRGKLGGGGGLKGVINTSVVAEMMAISNALHHAIKSFLILQDDKILIQTDCTPAIDTYKGLRNNLDHQEQKCCEWFNKIIIDMNLSIEFRHVKGHTSKTDARSITNKLCDKRAKAAMKKVRLTMVKQIG